ncbi:hypothetical protein [Streptomyces sp. NBC_00525]|uniref:hypothetical protein n=1 Tax=Streptomyces sp. NBC_00525 TaxID=2903660 RepID=UPI002E808C44|nr:hypothetical protein [Streptomyces sp. NBC_00525]WUC97424.1 hypothetical protein OG710_29090 [Streptomyces sp. NBC_00525]
MATNFKISTAARNAACNAIVDLLDAGSGAATITIYSGSQPAGPDTSTGATALVTFTLDSTAAYGAASSGTATLDVSPAVTATASATGTASWFRAADSSGNAVFDGSVGESSADLIFNTTSITMGNTCEITGHTVTVPAS